MNARPTPLARAAGVAALVTVLAASPAPWTPAVRPAAGATERRLAVLGASIRAPEGAGWVTALQTSWRGLLGRRLPGESHMLVATILVTTVYGPRPGLDSLIARTRREIEQRERNRSGEIHFTEFEIAADTATAGVAVAYRYRYHAPRAPGAGPGGTVVEAHGRRIVHPDADLLIEAFYDEAAPPAARMVGLADAPPFLESLRLARVEAPLEPARSLERWVYGGARSEDAFWLARRRDEGGAEGPGELVRLDPATLAVTGTVSLGAAPSRVVCAGPSVWVVAEESVLRVDPRALRVESRIRCGDGLSNMAWAGGALWVTDEKRGGVWRIDPNSDTSRRIRLSDSRSSCALLPRDSLLWVSDLAGRLHAIDPATGSPSGPPVGVGEGAVSLAWAAGALWVSSRGTGTIQRVDPVARRVTASVALAGTLPGAVVEHGGHLWVSDSVEGTLTRIDPVRAQVVGKPVRPGFSFVPIATPDGLWILDTIAHRVGRMKPEAP
uniref:SMP-30/Gluconolactonase/LRE-like region domain-containing protein n=1 Tax=Eiseniibacteriota bacterium TaxID=2212470 RepID=A0A832I347_UNCEI